VSVRRILSIDGGGIKGVLPAAFLATIEDVTGERVLDHFDLITGTSTGGILALGLALDRPASRLLELYTQHGARIFAQDDGPRSSIFSTASRRCRDLYRSVRGLLGPKYEPDALRGVLEEEYGGARLGDCQTRVVIPAFDRQRRDLHVFKTAHHERLRSDWPQLAVDVALATAAAPTYFPEHSLGNGISLIDGGVWANNPVGLGVVEAIGVLGWEPARSGC
jgi:patatin-like phospholipase/acyl hydrolase